MKFLISLLLLLLTSGQIQPAEDVEVRLVELAREQLTGLYPDASFNVDLRWIPSRLQDVPVGDIQGIRINSPDVPRALVSAEVLASDKTYPVQFFIKTILRVPVARSLVSKDEVISDDLIEVKQIDVTNFGQLPADRASFRGMTARNEISAGELIYHSDLSEVEVVDRGASVVMQYRMNGLRIEMNCETRQSGAKGDLITVRCSETGKRYEVKVRDGVTVIWRRTF